MTKSQIENAAISGTSIGGRVVARVTRAGAVVLRHVWPDNCDSRVWDSVKRAARRLAQERADETGRTIGLYHADGPCIDEVQPCDEVAL